MVHDSKIDTIFKIFFSYTNFQSISCHVDQIPTYFIAMSVSQTTEIIWPILPV